MVMERIAKGEVLSSQSNKDINKLTHTDIIKATNMEDPLCIEIVEEVGINWVNILPASSISSIRVGNYWWTSSRNRRIYHAAHTEFHQKTLLESGQ
jgi:hypothetical protein